MALKSVNITPFGIFSGEFGIVYKAILTKGPAGLQTRSTVAVKTLKGMYKW